MVVVCGGIWGGGGSHGFQRECKGISRLKKSLKRGTKENRLPINCK